MSPSLVFSALDADYALAMDAASATAARINKFDGTNFHTWKCKMQMVLEERDLWEVASGEVKPEHLTSVLYQVTYSASPARRWRSSVLRWRIRSYRWSGRRVEHTMHGHG